MLMHVGVLLRFEDAMTDYCQGILQQVGHGLEGKIPGTLPRNLNQNRKPLYMILTMARLIDVEEYMDARRSGVGVAPVFPLIEYEPSSKIHVIRADPRIDMQTILTFLRIFTTTRRSGR